MKHILKYILITVFAFALQACDDDILDSGKGSMPTQEEDSIGSIVMLSAGNEALSNTTRAAKVNYMPSKIRFTTMMLVKINEESEYKYQQPVNAYMIVDNDGVGNSWYYKKDYSTPIHFDDYKNDDDATVFYWQNRNTHGFIGYIDDYNKALKSLAQDGEPYNPKSMSGWITDEVSASSDANKGKFIFTKDDEGIVNRWQQFEKVDLRNSTYTGKSIGDMPDPLIAYAEKKPVGSAAESNRVYLTFRHQLSQIVVNLKGSKESADLKADQIDKVELLGVSEYAYVFPYPEYGFTTQIIGGNESGSNDEGNDDADNSNSDEDDSNAGDDGSDTGNGDLGNDDGDDSNNEGGEDGNDSNDDGGDDGDNGNNDDGDAGNNDDGSDDGDDEIIKIWSIIRQGKTQELLRKAMGSVTAPEKYTEEEPYGTSFTMFNKSEVEENYLKSFECVAFGNLDALRITWHEEGENGISHVITFKISDAKFKELESGKRYIYNLELQRGTLAVVRTVIDDWIPLETLSSEEENEYIYTAPGILDKESNKQNE